MAPRKPHLSLHTEGIPHRDEAEQAVRDAEERTSAALVATRTAIWELDLERGEVIWSSNLDQLVQRPLDRFTVEEGLRCVHPADADRHCRNHRPTG